MDRLDTEPHLDSLLKKFQDECNDCLNVYYQCLRLYNEHPDLFSERMRNMLVEHMILRLFGAWEKYLEDIFIAYMLGEHSRNGSPANRYVNPTDKDHAYRMIRNVNLYPDWSDVDKILTNARNFFENGGAFEILKTLRSEITSWKKIRNAIAHTSSQSKKEFENLVQGKVGYLPEGISPARFLIEFKPEKRRNAPAYFEYYVFYLRDTAKILAEYDGTDGADGEGECGERGMR